jgi:dienelactone hydrolase
MKTQSGISVIMVSVGIIAGISLKAPSKPASTIKEENISFKVDTLTLKGFVAYDENVKGKRPAVLVVHEWWGLNDYPKMRARKLAELGYIAMAVDLFGNGKIAANPKEAMELTGPFYTNPQLGESRLQVAIDKIKEYPQTDKNNVAAIGHCFGGAIVLNAAKMGADLKGVVSFHGGLSTAIPVNKNTLKAKILICYGAADKFISQKDADAFTHQLDSLGAKYTFKSYPNATHAFTNPAATENGKKFNMPTEYNPEADKNSWNDMKMFFDDLFKK